MTSRTWTIREVLDWTAKDFAARGIESQRGTGRMNGVDQVGHETIVTGITDIFGAHIAQQVCLFLTPNDVHQFHAVRLADTIQHLAQVGGRRRMQDCALLFHPGRFDKTNAPPFGLAVALTFQGGQSSGPLLRLYPIMTDNSVTGFQNRPVTTEEFSSAVQHLSGGTPQRYRTGRDAVGYHLTLELSELSSASKPNFGLETQ